MIPMSLGDAARYAEGTITSPAAGMLTAAVTDTRQITPGALFCAIHGARVDGATLAGQALAGGALAVLTENPAAALASGADPARIIAVRSVPEAMGKLATANLALARQHNRDLRVVAITGSVGKTTTKDLLAGIAIERGEVVAPPGSLNNEIGLPLTVLRVGPTTATLVAEMGADHIGNIAYLTSIAPPDVAVELIVARAHLGEFGGIENVARAKSELIQGEVRGGTSVLNLDDERVMNMRQFATGPVLTFSPAGNRTADVYAENVHMDEADRAVFDLVTPGGTRHISLGLVGAHHVANALAAASAALALGLDLDAVAGHLGAHAASPHRMDVFTPKHLSVTVIDDAYNANPDSMRAGIRSLGRIGRTGRRVAVLGAMLELGDASAREHASLVAPLQEAGVSALVVVGKEAQPLAEAACRAGIAVRYLDSVAGTQDAVTDMLKDGDTVLIKGSNGSNVWRVADALREA
ncbi:UDP-N-acetylmuramoyl-tripeptide--D-alanyl-D-alanine ligase [Neoactinobaculum massilliense]|uniref:UDP-N-acetylmuramoyl-tripeptide--D-alanyl-D- alanine ligase n=1 Tax=Neoactinobaculum massilliense TaxID=2364794 RepID=UPI000F522538|nr:UDP-N-acetylmuramoyl-tripeptide--D-alanyl-D-alanine ligase [Neoactinobaculum massilliense]